VPGQSNHGWARALDVTGFESRADVWASMNRRAAECGLSNATGQDSGERWHWECVLPPTTTASLGATPITEGFLMALTDAEQAEVLNAVRNLYSGTFVGGPSMKDGGHSISQSLADIGAILRRPVQRVVDGKNVNIEQIQDNADTNTMVRALTAQVGALTQTVAHLAVGQGADPAAITAAAKAGAQQALASLTLKAAG
jgi:hypothetical protein